MNRGHFLDPKGRELAISLGFFEVLRLVDWGFCAFSVVLFIVPTKAAILASQIFKVFEYHVWFGHHCRWFMLLFDYFDKMLFLHGITQQYTRTEEPSVWYAQRLRHEPSNDVWSLILFLQFLFFFSSSLSNCSTRSKTVPASEKQNESLIPFNVRQSIVIGAVQWIIQEGLNLFQIYTYSI